MQQIFIFHFSILFVGGVFPTHLKKFFFEFFIFLNEPEYLQFYVFSKISRFSRFSRISKFSIFSRLSRFSRILRISRFSRLSRF